MTAVRNSVDSAGTAYDDRAMASLVHTFTIDAHDAYAQAQWWSQVLDVPMSPEDNPGDPEALLRTDHGDVLFIVVPDDKVVKNRAHLDLMPSDRRRDEEVERVIALGASVVADHRNPDGSGWVTLADPEGNEFCVVRSQSER